MDNKFIHLLEKLNNLELGSLSIDDFYNWLACEYPKNPITNPYTHIIGELINELDRLRHDFYKEFKESSRLDIEEFQKEYIKVAYTKEFLEDIKKKINQ